MQLDVNDEEVKTFQLRKRLKEEKNILIILDIFGRNLNWAKLRFPLLTFDNTTVIKQLEILKNY